MATAKQVRLETFCFSSDIKNDIWHPKPTAHGYECWYFDALSDNGKDALVIAFLDNFIFSPRYNKTVVNPKPEIQISKSPDNTASSPVRIPQSNVPAVALIYYCDGKLLYRAVNEFLPEDFSAGEELPECKIGESSFKFESAPYGSGYSLSIKAELSRRRKIEANLEWLSIESDLSTHEISDDSADKHNWNLAAPRSDVTGSIKVSDAQGKLLDVRHFRGTGYHDHTWDTRKLLSTVNYRYRGRAHFDNCTAVFYRYCELDSNVPVTKLFLIKENEIEEFDAEYREKNLRRSLFGLKFPQKISLKTATGIELKIIHPKPIDENIFYLHFLGEANLTLPDKTNHEAFALTEYLSPKNLKHRWLDWAVDMRIGRNGKGAFF